MKKIIVPTIAALSLYLGGCAATTTKGVVDLGPQKLTAQELQVSQQEAELASQKLKGLESTLKAHAANNSSANAKLVGKQLEYKHNEVDDWVRNNSHLLDRKGITQAYLLNDSQLPLEEGKSENLFLNYDSSRQFDGRDMASAMILHKELPEDYVNAGFLPTVGLNLENILNFSNGNGNISMNLKQIGSFEDNNYELEINFGTEKSELTYELDDFNGLVKRLNEYAVNTSSGAIIANAPGALVGAGYTLAGDLINHFFGDDEKELSDILDENENNYKSFPVTNKTNKRDYALSQVTQHVTTSDASFQNGFPTEPVNQALVLDYVGVDGKTGTTVITLEDGFTGYEKTPNGVILSFNDPTGDKYSTMFAFDAAKLTGSYLLRLSAKDQFGGKDCPTCEKPPANEVGGGLVGNDGGGAVPQFTTPINY